MDTTYLVFDHREGSASEAVSSVVEERQLRDQPFRIYRIVPDLDKITVYARHVFYDLLDNMIQSYKPSSSAVLLPACPSMTLPSIPTWTAQRRMWSLKT